MCPKRRKALQTRTKLYRRKLTITYNKLTTPLLYQFLFVIYRLLAVFFITIFRTYVCIVTSRRKL